MFSEERFTKKTLNTDTPTPKPKRHRITETESLNLRPQFPIHQIQGFFYRPRVIHVRRPKNYFTRDSRAVYILYTVESPSIRDTGYTGFGVLWWCCVLRCVCVVHLCRCAVDQFAVCGARVFLLPFAPSNCPLFPRAP